MRKLKLAIADDSDLFRKAISDLIRIEPDFEVVLVAKNGLELLELLPSVTADIVLLDIRMPIMDGIETSLRLKTHYPQIKIIALSQYDLEANLVKMYIHGVKSFFGKEERSEELFKAIRIVHEGGVYMTDRAANIVQRHLCNQSTDFSVQPSITCEFEKSFLRMMVEGLTSKQIGEKIHKSHRTVEEMREKLYLKFNVRNKTQLIALAAKADLQRIM